MDFNDAKNKSVDVSVVIPCYCCADTIRRAVTSIYEQTYRPSEVVLVNDCSPDRTLQKLYELQDEFSDEWIKVVSTPVNSGPSKARNIGWEVSSRSYLAFLDADDSWHPLKIEKQFFWMSDHTDVSLTGHVSVLSGSADKDPSLDDVLFRPLSKRELLFSNKFSTSSVMVKTQLPFRFNEFRSYSEDFELWCDIAFANNKCFVMGEGLTFVHKGHFGKSGLSSNLWRMEKGELSAFRKLWVHSHIDMVTYIVCVSWSISKYIRRCIKTYLVGN